MARTSEGIGYGVGAKREIFETILNRMVKERGKYAQEHINEYSGNK